MTSPLALGRRADEHGSAEDAVAAFLAGGWRDRLMAALAGGFERRLGRAAIADAVDEALTRALTELRPRRYEAGRPVYPAQELFAWALQTARRRLLDEQRHNSKAAAPVHGVELDQLRTVADRHTPTPEETVVARELAHQVREAAIELDDVSLRAVALFHVQGLKKREVGEVLGLTEWELRRCLEKANRKLHAIFVGVDSGAACRSGRTGVLRLAFGLAEVKEARRARAHVRHCPECARQLARAGAYRRAAAAVVPLPVLAPGQLAAGGVLERLFAAGREALTQLQLLPARLTGGIDGGASAVTAGRAGVGATTAGATKLLAICAAGGAIVAGGRYCAVELLPGNHPERAHASRTAAVRTNAGAQPSPASSSSSALLLVRHPRAESSEPASRSRQSQRRERAQNEGQGAAEPDEFFSSAAQPDQGSHSASVLTSAATPNATAAPAQSGSSSQPDEFPLP